MFAKPIMYTVSNVRIFPLSSIAKYDTRDDGRLLEILITATIHHEYCNVSKDATNSNNI